MQFTLTCNVFDKEFNPIIRIPFTVDAEDLHSAFEKAKSKLARKYKTSPDNIDITGVERHN